MREKAAHKIGCGLAFLFGLVYLEKILFELLGVQNFSKDLVKILALNVSSFFHCITQVMSDQVELVLLDQLSEARLLFRQVDLHVVALQTIK